MAATQPATISIGMVDELGTPGSACFYALVDPAATVTEVEAQAATVAGLVDGLVGTKITRVSVSLESGPTGKSSPAAGSRIEQTAVINFRNAVNAHRWGEAIPGLADDAIVAGKVDPAAIAPLATALTTGTALVKFTNQAGQLLGAAVDAFVSFRKRRVLDRTSLVELP